MDFKQQARDGKELMGKLAQATPEVIGAFRSLNEVAHKERALGTKTKELIALALGVQARCIPCITSHAQGALSAGATREEVVEALEVTITMGGGPSAAHSAIALEAFDQLSKK